MIVEEPEEHTYMWTKLHEGQVISGGYLPGILHEEANSTGIPVCSWHIFFESAPGEVNGPIIDLKASDRERPVEKQELVSCTWACHLSSTSLPSLSHKDR